MVALILKEGAIVGQSTFIYILRLEAAFLEKPVLQTGHYLVHVA